MIFRSGRGTRNQNTNWSGLNNSPLALMSTQILCNENYIPTPCPNKYLAQCAYSYFGRRKVDHTVQRKLLTVENFDELQEICQNFYK